MSGRAGLRAAAVALVCALTLSTCGSDSPTIEPQPLDQPTPFKYPVDLWDQAVQGDVVVLVRVTRTGDVDSTAIFQSSGYPQMDSAAVRGGRRLRFVPGRRGTRLLERWVKVPVRFARDSAASVSGVTVGGQ
jgi:TonB family protein